MSQLSLLPTVEAGESPFDALRGPDGYWSARDLMDPFGYSRWQRFAESIDRAMASCEASGEDVTSNFTGVGKVSERGPEGQDYRLTRFGAYLVAMNGDPRKPEIAAAQRYFAVKTREAEVKGAQEPRTLTRRELALAVIEAEDAREAAERALEEAQPALRQHARFLDASGSHPIAVVAKALGVGQNKLFAFLREHGVLISTAGARFNTPYQRHVEAGRFEVVMGSYERSDGTEESTWTTRCTPKGQAYIHQLIEKHGRP